MALQVKLPAGRSAAPFMLLARNCFGTDNIQTSSDASLQDVTLATKSIGKPWATVVGHKDIYRKLAHQSRQKEQLLGSDEEAKKQVSEWVDFLEPAAECINDDQLQKLSDHLLTRSYLVGNALTLADLAVYAAVHPTIAALPADRVPQLVNLVRWFDHMQQTADSGSAFPKVAVSKPDFRLLPPPAAAPAKDKAAAKGGKENSTPAKAITPADTAAEEASASAPAGAGAAAPAQGAPEDGDAKAQKKKDKREKKAAKAAVEPAAPAQPSITVLDIRVGVITAVEPHPDADGLYVEQIDLGEGAPRVVVSGLRKFVPLEAMQGRRVVVLANLKPANMRGVSSAGMVLCASNDDHTEVDPISPPEGAAIGERITFEGYEGEPEAQLNPRKKVFEKLAPDLKTNSEGLATFAGTPFQTTAGPVTAMLKNASVK